MNSNLSYSALSRVAAMKRQAQFKGFILSQQTMIKQEFLRLARRYPVAAAIKAPEDLEVALPSAATLLFILKGDAFQLSSTVAQAHKVGKGVVVHIDLVSGVGKDRAGRSEEHTSELQSQS